MQHATGHTPAAANEPRERTQNQPATATVHFCGFGPLLWIFIRHETPASTKDAPTGTATVDGATPHEEPARRPPDSVGPVSQWPSSLARARSGDPNRPGPRATLVGSDTLTLVLFES